MSSSPLGSITLLGGVPTHKDLAPSIFFVVLYVLTIPLYVWRQVRPHSRSLTLIRPGIFIVARIVVFIVRAIMSKGNASEGLFICDLILLTLGFVLLIDPLVNAWGSMAYPLVLLHTPNPSDESAQKKGKHWILRVKLLFRALILVVVITGIVIGSQVSSAIDDPQGGAVDTIKTLKKVNYVVSLVLVVLVAAGTLLTFVRYPAAVPTKKLAHVLGTCAPLLVVSAYKVAQNEDSNQSSWIHSTDAFWILLVTFEWLALISILAVPWAEWYPSEKQQKKESEHQNTELMTKIYGAQGASTQGRAGFTQV